MHTSYTDGKNTVDEYCQKAQEKGYPLICFAEHIRIEPTYSPDDYLADISRADDKYDIPVLGGFAESVRLVEDLPPLLSKAGQSIHVFLLSASRQ